MILKFAAALLFAIAALGSFGWLIHLQHATVTGLIASGLLCLVVSLIDVPQPPPPR